MTNKTSCASREPKEPKSFANKRESSSWVSQVEFFVRAATCSHLNKQQQQHKLWQCFSSAFQVYRFFTSLLALASFPLTVCAECASAGSESAAAEEDFSPFSTCLAGERAMPIGVFFTALDLEMKCNMKSLSHNICFVEPGPFIIVARQRDPIMRWLNWKMWIWTVF